jgi:putative flavoprotein involved in K+ transport
MATFQRPKLPTFASEISGAIRQLHSSEYKRPSQLNPGSALVVGAGNSGAEIALELARSGFQVTLSGRDVGQVPFKVDGLAAKMGLSQIVLRGVFHRLLTVDTPMGRKVRPKLLQHGGPLIRVKSAQLQQAGVVRAGRVEGVRNGLPYLSDGTALEVDNIIWCTGFEPGMSWIDLPVFDHAGEPAHSKGIVENSPGLYFVGLHFLYALSSTMIHGVSRDAKRIVSHLAAKRTSSVADTVV